STPSRSGFAPWQAVKSYFGRSAEPTLDAVEPAVAQPPAVDRETAYDEVRPLGPRIGDALDGLPLTLDALTKVVAGPACEDMCRYFHNYPRSLMGDKSRAVLFALVRMARPKIAAEIGTYFAGCTEVIARALRENGEGFLHTTDPFDANRCREIIARWPDELQNRVRFHGLNSMDFLLKLHREQVVLDFVLIDGDHDYEPVLFDLHMAARLLRPGGIVVMNDSVQSGPFQAARTFLASHSGWQELGTALASYDEGSPFTGGRASQPGIGFLILQAPSHWSLDA